MFDRYWFSDLSSEMKGFVIIISPIFSLIVFSLFYRIFSSKEITYHFHILPIFLGLIYQSYRITKSPKTISIALFFSFLLSFLTLFPGKKESNYNLNEHLENWPYFLIGVYILIIITFLYKKITPKLTEGVTLLLTFSINYWIFENGYYHTDNPLIITLLVVNLAFSLFSVIHVFTHIKLNKPSRFILSFWSTIISIVLSSNNFYSIFNNDNLEIARNFEDGILPFFSFFLLGISSIYFAQNLVMILAYFPGKEYLDTIYAMTDYHISRFSDQQVYLFDSILVSLITISTFYFNFRYHYFSVNITIWGLMLLTPIYLKIINTVTGKI